jgi:hypothetical protein
MYIVPKMRNKKKSIKDGADAISLIRKFFFINFLNKFRIFL